MIFTQGSVFLRAYYAYVYAHRLYRENRGECVLCLSVRGLQKPKAFRTVQTLTLNRVLQVWRAEGCVFLVPASEKRRTLSLFEEDL